MHHKTHEKYVKLKGQGLTAEELKADMLANGITEAEADQFITEAYNPETNGGNTPPADKASEAPEEATQQPPVPPVVVESAAMSPAVKFDYKNLTGKEYEAYVGYVASLPLFDLRQFDCFKARPLMKERYPGMPNTPSDMVGLEITTDKPLHTTKIDIKTANELNAQLANSGRIYLLKQ